MHRKRGVDDALGFGFGPHRCVAEALARAELEIVFGEWPSPLALILDASWKALIAED